VTPDITATPDALASADTDHLALAFVSDEGTAAAVRKCFIDLSLVAAQVERGSVDAAVAMLGRVHSPKLLVVDISKLDAPLIKLRRLAEVCDPSTSVLVIGEHNDVVLHRGLKELGVAEYFFKPIMPELLERACRTAIGGPRNTVSPHAGKLIAVFGVRGGVGCSTIAVNTAWYLAEALKRHVALLDLDLQGGDAALQLDVEPSHALREALEHPERVDDLLLARAVTTVTERLAVLASLESINDPFVPAEDAVLGLLGRLQARHRYVFVDVPHNFGARLHKVLDQASMLILVCDPTLVSAREMTRWRELFKSTGPDHTVWQILNKAGAPGVLPEADFARALGEAPHVVVRFDPEIVKAANLGHPALPQCRSLLHGLAPLFKSLAGEAERERPPLLARLFRP
jgi:pilus assembly protein CpaE